MIIQNAIRIKATGELLVSKNRHDFVARGEGDSQVFVDGGNDYIRRGGLGELFEDFSVTDDMPLITMVERLAWGTYGIDGKSPLKFILLKDCSTEHLQAILDNVKNIGEYHKSVINCILSERNFLDKDFD